MIQYILCVAMSICALSVGAQQLISPVLATPVPAKVPVPGMQQTMLGSKVHPNQVGIQQSRPDPLPTPAYLLVGSSDLQLTRTVPLSRLTTSIAEMASWTTVGNTKLYEPMKISVLDVMDRGEILVQTKEQVRIRGARVPSEKATRRVDVIYAREANAWLKNRLLGKETVQLEFFDSPRDRYGALYGRFLLTDEDNADILKGLLENGLARLNEEDLWSSAPLEELRALEEKARKDYKGIWSERD